MAEVITRFKLETTQYDSKLRDASKSLQEFTKTATLAGNEFGKFTQKNVETARAFGNIATSATNSKDKVKELVGAFNDVAKAYNALTKEQQQSDFGKALAESMTTLKGRIAEAKQEMNSAGGVLSQLKDKITINIDAMKLFNVGVTAAKGALEVAKDAFFASEASVDEWGRVMDSSKSLYEGFLTSLNTGDITGYLSRIDQIVNAARAAYDELDRLGTMKTIQAPKMSAQQTENDRMRMMIQTGRYIAPIDGRKASMQNGQLLTAEQIKRIEKQLENGMKSITSLIGNEVTQTTKAIHAVYTRQGAELGMSVKEFKKGTSSMAEFDKRMAGYDQYQKWRAEHTTIDMQSGRETVARGNPFEQFAKWGVFRVDGERYNELVKLIQQRDQQAGQAYSMQSQAYRTMNRAEGVTVSKIMNGETTSGGGGGKGGGNKTEITYASDSIAAQQALVQQLTKQWNEAGASVRDQYVKPLVEAEAKLKEMQNAQALAKEQAQGKLLGNTPDGQNIQIPVQANISSSLIPSIDEIREKLKNDPIIIPIETAASSVKKITEAAKTTAQVVGTIGQAFDAIEDPAAKVAGIIAQAIASVALAYSQTLAEDQSSKSNVWAFIAAAAAAMISMTTTIATIHGATGYAHGGIVKGRTLGGINVLGYAGGGTIAGNTYSNDQIPIMANAGEVVLTKAMQGNLASVLSDQERGGGMSMSRVSGEQIYVVLDRYMRRSGRGEILTWK